MYANKHKQTTRRKTTSRSRPKNALSSKRRHSRRWNLRWHHIGGLGLLLLGLSYLTFALVIQPVGRGSADSCTVSASLVNSCRPWLGATALNYPAAPGDSAGTNVKIQALYHETRINRQLDIVHTYHAQGHNALTANDTYFATRANTMLFANWKPGNSGDSWATVASGADDSAITGMANSIKALGAAKMFLTIWHEPENDVSPGGDPSCPSLTYKGTSGSVGDYLNMWHHVRSVFDADGVSNVVWAMDYMNYSAWDCLVPDLYPGDGYVDWVVFNAYQPSAGAGFETTVQRFENVLNGGGVGTSKPRGIVEWGANKFSGQTSAQSLADEEAYYESAKTALDNNDSTIAKLKMYMIFDENDQGATGCTAVNLRVGYDDDCNPSSAKQAAYNDFADDPRLTNGFYTPPADTTPPTVSLTAPGNGATVSGTVTVAGTAGDNVGVSSVSLYVDGNTVATDTSSPYNFSLDTAMYSNATHNLQLKASDAAGNIGSSAIVTVTVSNQSVGGGTVSSGGSTSGTTSTTTVTIGSTPSSTPIPVKGTLVIDSAGGGAVQVSIDGRKAGTNIDTTKLTNGVHTVTVTRDGKTVTQKITVHNPWLTAVRNDIAAHPAAYTAGSGGGLLIIGLVVWLNRYALGRLLMRLRGRPLFRFGTGQIVGPFRR